MNHEGRTATESILLRGEEVAEMLGVSRAKAYRLMQRREIPVVMFGASVRCPRESLLNYIRQRTEHPSGSAAAYKARRAAGLIRKTNWNTEKL